MSTEAKWKDFIASLGESAVAFELLQTKCTSPVKVEFDASGGSSKGNFYFCSKTSCVRSVRTLDLGSKLVNA